jgi:hypothetical protein
MRTRGIQGRNLAVEHYVEKLFKRKVVASE